MSSTSPIGQALSQGSERRALSDLGGIKPSQTAFSLALEAMAIASAAMSSMPGQASGESPAAMPGGPGPGGQAAPGGQRADKPKEAPKLSADQKRPDGDTRSAQEIIDGDPTLKNLGNQSGVKDNLRKQVGDFEHDPDAAYRASQVLQHVKQSKDSDGKERSGDVTDNGKIEGFTKDGDARHGTEAGLLQDFGKYGYSALKDDQTLDKTSDGHVKKDGTNMDNAAFVGHEIVHGLSEAAGWIGKELDKLPGPLKSLFGPLHMVSEAASGGLNVADAALTGGDVKQAGKDMAHGLLSTGAGIVQGAADLLDSTVGKVPGLGKLANAAVQPLATAASGGLNVADTAVQGGDVGQAAKQMGYNVAGSAVESAVGLADPTGVAAGAAGDAVRDGLEGLDKGRAGDGTPKGGPSVGDSNASGSSGAGRSGKKGGGATAGSTTRGGAATDNSAGAGTRAPKRTADDAGLPTRADATPKTARSDRSTNGTYADRKNERDRLDIQTGSGTHQSEHVVGYAVLHDGNRRQNSAAEGRMPAYYEETKPHRDHAGTGSSSISSPQRLDQTGWPSSAAYRNDQRTAMQDPAARQQGTSVSNAYQLNQLGYAQQQGYTARQNPGQPPAPIDPRVTNSYSNTVNKDPGIEHSPPGSGMVTDRLNPRGQAEALLAHETRITGKYPTLERENEVRKQFGI